MSAFADSSALVKLYVPEANHELVSSLPGSWVIATIARVEVPAAFWGKVRAGELLPADASLLSSAFEFDYHGDQAEPPRFVAVPASNQILVNAARLAAVHGLRAYESVQLACATAARGVDSTIDTFVAFDRRLCEAALIEGFSVLGA